MEYLKLIIFIIFIISVFSFLSLAPWVPTRKSDLGRIQKILKLKNGEKFLEIGCGTAGVSIFVAKNNPNSQIIGIEFSPLFYLISKIRVFFNKQKNIKIIYGNALNLKLENFDVIYVFGLPETITNKIFPKIKNIKNKNFRFISYAFKMTNNYFKETKHKIEGKNSIYEYKI